MENIINYISNLAIPSIIVTIIFAIPVIIIIIGIIIWQYRRRKK